MQGISIRRKKHAMSATALIMIGAYSQTLLDCCYLCRTVAWACMHVSCCLLLTGGYPNISALDKSKMVVSHRNELLVKLGAYSTLHVVKIGPFEVQPNLFLCCPFLDCSIMHCSLFCWWIVSRQCLFDSSSWTVMRTLFLVIFDFVRTHNNWLESVCLPDVVASFAFLSYITHNLVLVSGQWSVWF